MELQTSEGLPQSSEGIPQSQFPKSAKWCVLLATGFLFFSFIGFLTYHAWLEKAWILELVKAHFAAVIGLPSAGIAALCVVLLLEFSTGPIEFEGLSVKFRGATGPVILWILTFLAITWAIKTLW